MADKILFDIALPAPPEGPNDIKALRLTVLADGQEVTADYDPAATVATGFAATQDSDVHVEAHYVDDAGNLSEPSVLEFVAVDTIAPPAPGALGVLVRGEVTEPTPEPTPAPPDEQPEPGNG